MEEKIVPTSKQWQERWGQLLEWIGAPIALMSAGDRLFQHYDKPERAYHNPRHVLACLEALDQYPDPIEDTDAAEIALWYHDAIYDVTATNNEARSAALCRRECVDYIIDQVDPMLVDQLILATRHRFKPARPIEAVVMDIDLSILGTDPARYDQYAEAIRQEYSHLSEEAYRAGRAKFLKQTLSRHRLYWTKHYHALHETPARQNLVRELNHLGSVNTFPASQIR